MVPAVACDARGQHTLASRNVDVLRTTKYHDPAPLPSLMLCWICRCWWVGVFWGEGSVDIAGVDSTKDRNGCKGAWKLLGLLATVSALSLSTNAVVAALKDLGHVMVTHQPGV
jgi:hypothetical protein